MLNCSACVCACMCVCVRVCVAGAETTLLRVVTTTRSCKGRALGIMASLSSALATLRSKQCYGPRHRLLLVANGVAALRGRGLGVLGGGKLAAQVFQVRVGGHFYTPS